jgi:hypothetical protein
MKENPQLAALMLDILDGGPVDLDAVLGRGPIDCELYEHGGRTCCQRLTVGDLDLLSPATMLLAVLGDAELEALMPPAAVTATRAALLAESGPIRGRLLALAAVLSMVPVGGKVVGGGITVDGREFAI